jgi:Predicted periplasmic lipoprotein (DUF2279)
MAVFVCIMLLLAPRCVYAQESSAAPAPIRGRSIESDSGSFEPSACSLRILRAEAGECGAAQLAGVGFGLSSDEDPAPAADSKLWGYEKRQLGLAALVSAGVIAGGSISTFLETPRQSFHWTNEGFFGRDTYAGGADKASHFVDYAIVTKELANLYGVIGFSRRDSILMGLGVATLTGFVFEIGDGTNIYGFSWEDLTMDVLGAGTAALISALELDDVVGFRHGFLLPPPSHDVCCAVDGKGRDYSNEIYTADLHIAGLARRLGVKVGPLRYLFLSLTYGTKGYPHGLDERRERQLGIEIGLNFGIILTDLGVRRDTWWGYTLHVVFDNLRVPFTAVGFRYDLNSRKWTGPDSGNGYATR